MDSSDHTVPNIGSAVDSGYVSEDALSPKLLADTAQRTTTPVIHDMPYNGSPKVLSSSERLPSVLEVRPDFIDESSSKIHTLDRQKSRASGPSPCELQSPVSASFTLAPEHINRDCKADIDISAAQHAITMARQRLHSLIRTIHTSSYDREDLGCTAVPQAGHSADIFTHIFPGIRITSSERNMIRSMTSMLTPDVGGNPGYMPEPPADDLYELEAQPSFGGIAVPVVDDDDDELEYGRGSFHTENGDEFDVLLSPDDVSMFGKENSTS